MPYCSTGQKPLFYRVLPCFLFFLREEDFCVLGEATQVRSTELLRMGV